MVLASQGQLGGAIDALRQATKLLEDLSAEDPTNAAIRGFLADSYQFLGADLKDSGDLPDGLQYLRKARSSYQILSQADPQDAWLPYRLGYVDISISDLLFKIGNAEKGFGACASPCLFSKGLWRSILTTVTIAKDCPIRMQASARSIDVWPLSPIPRNPNG